ncbi:MAG: hypothetical protein Sapg2KO_44700 [Saprospiraceae bacterium]
MFSSFAFTQVKDPRFKIGSFLDMTPGRSGVTIENLTSTGDKIFFESYFTFGAPGKSGLYASDGSSFDPTASDSTKQAGTCWIYPGANEMTALNGLLYFTFYDNEAQTFRVLVSDGTLEGTNQIMTSPFVNYLYPLGDRMLIISFEEIWISDGTVEGTELIRELPIPQHALADVFLDLDGKFYFFADDGIHGTELWVTDGTTEGTFMVYDINEGSGTSKPSQLTAFNGRVYFTAVNKDNYQEIWTTNGTRNDTYPITNFERGSFNIKQLTQTKSLIYYTYFGELWKYDLNQDTNLQVIDGLQVERLISAGDQLYFMPNWREALWVTRGSEESSVPVIATDFNTMIALYEKSIEALFFVPFDQAIGQEIWITNGQPKNTFLVEDHNPGSRSLSPFNFIRHQGQILFVGSRRENDREIYYLDYQNKSNISGQIFHDLNTNGKKDQGEPGVPNVRIQIDPQGEYVYSGDNGYYEAQVRKRSFMGDDFYDQYTVKPILDPQWTVTSDSISRSFEYALVNYEFDSIFNFGILPILDTTRAQLSLEAGTFNCDGEVPVWLNFQNQGSEALDGELSLELDNTFELIDTQDPIRIEGNRIYYSLENLLPGQSKCFKSTLRLTNREETDALQELKAFAQFQALNGPTITDTTSYKMLLNCAGQSNDKLVYPSTEVEAGVSYIQIGDWIRYTIRFQNVGGDTAYQVYLTDLLPSNLAIERFKQGVASHPYTTTLYREEGQISFFFRDLLLPDSSIDFTGSQGFVHFYIKPVDNVKELDKLRNTAEISFGFRPALSTNSIESTLVLNLDKDQDGFAFYEDCQDDNPLINASAIDIPDNGIDENCDGEDAITTNISASLDVPIKVFPNPASNKLQLQRQNSNARFVEIYNQVGQLLHQEQFLADNLSINVNQLEQGMVFVYFLDKHRTKIHQEKVIILR